MTMLVRNTIHSLSGMPVDNAVCSFVFNASATDAAKRAAVFGLLETFWRTNSTAGDAAAVGKYLSPEVDRSFITLEVYDIAAHLDGSPHGSPIETYQTSPIPAALSGTALPSEVAIVLSIAGIMTGIVEEGGEEEIPTPAAAIRMGAPETHLGRIRPKARRRGRIYLGPLNAACSAADAHGQLRVKGTTRDSLVASMNRLQDDSVTAAAEWSVWSRRAAETHQVSTGFVDDAFDTQRRRGPKATSRSTFS